MPRFLCGLCPFEAHEADDARAHLAVQHPDFAAWLSQIWGPWALACLGAKCWYWEQAQTGDAWRAATITGLGAKDGLPVFDVATLDGRPRWGWEWQIVLRVDGVPPAEQPAELRREPALPVAEADNKLRAAAAALLARVDTITSEDFQRGGERPQREQLRAVLRGAATDAEPWDVLLLERLYSIDAEDRAAILELASGLLEVAEKSQQERLQQDVSTVTHNGDNA